MASTTCLHPLACKNKKGPKSCDNKNLGSKFCINPISFLTLHSLDHPCVIGTGQKYMQTRYIS